MVTFWGHTMLQLWDTQALQTFQKREHLSPQSIFSFPFPIIIQSQCGIFDLPHLRQALKIIRLHL